MNPEHAAFRKIITKAKKLAPREKRAAINHALAYISTKAEPLLRSELSCILAQQLGEAVTREHIRVSAADRNILSPREVKDGSGFDVFWQAYPRKVGKRSAVVAWFRHVSHTNQEPALVIAGLNRWKESPQWQDPRFIPYPVKFLTEARWKENPEARGLGLASAPAAKRNEYTRYIKSDCWKVKRETVLGSEKNDYCRCEICGMYREHCKEQYGHDLDVHHLRYGRFGDEKSDELMPVCRGCHRILHGQEPDSRHFQSALSATWMRLQNYLETFFFYMAHSGLFFGEHATVQLPHSSTHRDLVSEIQHQRRLCDLIAKGNGWDPREGWFQDSPIQALPWNISSVVRPAERRLLQVLVVSEMRPELARAIINEGIHKGLFMESVFDVLLPMCVKGVEPNISNILLTIREPKRTLLADIVSQPASVPNEEEMRSCLAVHRRRLAASEMSKIQEEIQNSPDRPTTNALLLRKQELCRSLGDT